VRDHGLRGKFGLVIAGCVAIVALGIGVMAFVPVILLLLAGAVVWAVAASAHDRDAYELRPPPRSTTEPRSCVVIRHLGTQSSRRMPLQKVKGPRQSE
jgi:hypothetical protein